MRSPGRSFTSARDDEDPQLIWIRPSIGGYAPASDIDYAFHLSIARRRAVAYTTARLENGDIVLQVHNTQTARIQPATGECSPSFSVSV